MNATEKDRANHSLRDRKSMTGTNMCADVGVRSGYLLFILLFVPVPFERMKSQYLISTLSFTHCSHKVSSQSIKPFCVEDTATSSAPECVGYE